jgi:hypothetical protein
MSCDDGEDSDDSKKAAAKEEKLVNTFMILYDQSNFVL